MNRVRTRASAGAALAAVLLAGGCELGPKTSIETGFRGTGMQQVYDDSRLAGKVDATALPAAIPPTPATASTAPGNWQNVRVLTDVSQAEFNRTMVAMTQWVSPQQGCNYCHVPGNFASDSIYTKVVSRRMLQMVRDVNRDWQGHVAQTGVTCWTCHRGNPVPDGVWYFTDRNQPLRHYLDREDLRVQSASFLPSNDNRTSIKQTEYTYALMIGMSRSLGVSCTYCHQSSRWASWEQSTPQRLTALRGVRMARALNNEYLLPLQPVFPAERLGPRGDVPKIQCLTCHQGAYKPLYGARLAKDYPAMYWQHGAAGPPRAEPADSALAPVDSAGAPADSAAAAPAAPGAPTLPVPGAAPGTRTSRGGHPTLFGDREVALAPPPGHP